MIVVVLTSTLSSDPHRQPNAIATLDRLIYALLGWRRPAVIRLHPHRHLTFPSGECRSAGDTQA